MEIIQTEMTLMHSQQILSNGSIPMETDMEIILTKRVEIDSLMIQLNGQIQIQMALETT